FRNAYEETKFEAELLVRRAMSQIPAAVLRPSIVVGDSKTGEIDRFEGPYALAILLVTSPVQVPVPLPGDGVAPLNAVPIDYVVDAAAAIRIPSEQGMTMSNQDLVARAEKVLFQNYRTQPIALVRGEGTYVWDADGKRYLDFIGGIATVSAGHANAKVREAVIEQTKLLWHASNLYVTEPQVRLAEKLVRVALADPVYFCN